MAFLDLARILKKKRVFAGYVSPAMPTALLAHLVGF
jgi:hypothetical protein